MALPIWNTQWCMLEWTLHTRLVSLFLRCNTEKARMQQSCQQTLLNSIRCEKYFVRKNNFLVIFHHQREVQDDNKFFRKVKNIIWAIATKIRNFFFLHFRQTNNWIINFKICLYFWVAPNPIFWSNSHLIFLMPKKVYS